MLYPTKNEIIDAIKDSQKLPVPLREYECTMGDFELPLYYQGGFCLVFKMNKKGAPSLALRVWFAKVEDIVERLSGITNYIKENPQKYFVNFTIYREGLIVSTADGIVKLDIMTMEWVDGVDLKTYIKNIVNSQDAHNIKKRTLLELARELIEVFSSMHQMRVSHGDLQHSNILISRSGYPILIDYDSFFFYGTKYDKQITFGYLEYQHPSRCNATISNEKTDFFSELIICLAILSYAEDWTLWNRYAIDDLEYSILFTTKDFENIEKSPLYNELNTKSYSLHLMCQILKEYLHTMDINDITKPFMSYSSILSIFQLVGNFCINCGHNFQNLLDKYCIRCGTKRV